MKCEVMTVNRNATRMVCKQHKSIYKGTPDAVKSYISTCVNLPANQISKKCMTLHGIGCTPYVLRKSC